MAPCRYALRQRLDVLAPDDSDQDSGVGGFSADGSLIVGHSGSHTSSIQAVRWNAGTGTITPLGFLPGGGSESRALAASADGGVLVGHSDSSDAGAFGEREAFVHTESGFQALGDFAGGAFDSRATGVSADGGVVVGTGTDGLGPMAFRWTGGALEPLGELAGGAYGSMAYDVSADGSTIVGTSAVGGGTEAFRWVGGTMQGLGTFGLNQSTTAYGVTADGGRIVATSDSGAFLWQQNLGLLVLDAYLEGLGIDLEGWSLDEATGISDDGRRIVGVASRFDEGAFDFVRAPFLIVIPEPRTAALLAMGILGLALGRRRA